MKRILTILFCTATLLVSQDKPQKYWICFRDKDETALRTLSKSASLSDIAQVTGISERALARRSKVLSVGKLVTAEDLPVSSSYVEQMESAGISILNTSRWFNAVTATLTADQRRWVETQPFVERVEAVRTFIKRELPTPVLQLQREYGSSAIPTLHDYGPSFTQVNQIKVVDVHNLRITGRGVLVGMLDSGFRWRVAEATKNMNVIKEYDFVQHDSVTANESGKSPPDLSGQDGHGTITLSTVGGYKEGQLVSPAFGASFILAKTEYVPTETNGEEDNWVAGIEWEEQNGVDVVSSSLGYDEFNATDSLGNPQHSYVYADMNGRTAKTSKAAVLAARRGVVVCSANGNEAQNSWHYMSSPADADSILSVGAVDAAGVVASFSSVGPTADGRIKPDVAAQGVGTYSATVFPTAYTYSQGTSLSTPLVAGAAALVLSAHPELTPIQVRDALRNTASNSASPNNSIGWGVINTYKALLYYGMVFSTDPDVTTTPDGNTNVSYYIVSDSVIKKDSAFLYYSSNGGSTFSKLPMTISTVVNSATNSGIYTGVIPKQSPGAALRFYAYAVDATNKPRISLVVDTPPVPALFELFQNYPNPFNSSTSIQYKLERANYTTLKVYDILGREVATLVNEYETAGVRPPVQFNASRLASGVYFYRLMSGEYAAVKKLVLLK